jgi:hypothetical protein
VTALRLNTGATPAAAAAAVDDVETKEGDSDE